MKEEEIRPKSIFDEYLRLTKIDTKDYFDTVLRESILCPACGLRGEKAFNKHGFDYELCPKCDTLYVSPRPVNKAFISYYSMLHQLNFGQQHSTKLLQMLGVKSYGSQK